MLFCTYDRDIYYRPIIINKFDYTLYSSVFSLAKSLRLILEISTTYRFVGQLLADQWVIFGVWARNAWFPGTTENREFLHNFTYTANVRFKLRISQNRKWAYKNRSKQFLWKKRLCETTNLCVEVMKRKRQVKRKLGHVVQIRVCRLT